MSGIFTINYSTKEVFTSGTWRTRYIASAEIKGRKELVEALSDVSYIEAKDNVMTKIRNIKQPDVVAV